MGQGEDCNHAYDFGNPQVNPSLTLGTWDPPRSVGNAVSCISIEHDSFENQMYSMSARSNIENGIHGRNYRQK